MYLKKTNKQKTTTTNKRVSKQTDNKNSYFYYSYNFLKLTQLENSQCATQGKRNVNHFSFPQVLQFSLE